MKTYKPFLYSLGLIISLILVFYFLGEVIMPFVLGLAAAFMVDPIIKFIQKLIPNRKLAVTTFLGLSLTIFTGVLFLFGAEIVHDVKRLNNAFEIFAEDHQAEIDETNQTVKSYIEKIYSSDQVQQGIQQAQAEPDSAENTAIDQIQTAFSAVTSFFNSGG